MTWLSYAALAGIFWAGADILVRAFQSATGTLWSSFFLVIGMLVVTLGSALIFDRAHIPHFTNIFHYSPKLWGLVLAGVINALGYFFFFKFFAVGGNLAQGIPFLSIVSVLSVVIGGIIFFHDTLSLRTIFGIGTALLSLYLLH